MSKHSGFICYKRSAGGFTLAELLIALAILGVIATFTIPKVLQSQQDSRYKAMAKDAAATMSAAFEAYKREQGITVNTRPTDLTPYLNYVKLRTSGNLDAHNGAGTVTCSGTEFCADLHSGGALYLRRHYFNGTATTNAISFWFDPDGKDTDGTTNGPGKSVFFFLYTNGRLVSASGILPGTTDGISGYGANANADPVWFNWN